MKTVVVVLVAGILAVGCGGGGSPSSTTPPTPSIAASSGGAGVKLSMQDNFFSPSSISVAANGKLQISNDGAALHNFTLEAANLNQDVPPGSGHTFTITLAPGTYPFFCKYHRAVGMKGVLTVQ